MMSHGFGVLGDASTSNLEPGPDKGSGYRLTTPLKMASVKLFTYQRRNRFRKSRAQQCIDAASVFEYSPIFSKLFYFHWNSDIEALPFFPIARRHSHSLR
jgi:hypothetical protein